jgi:hypothetical protein
MDSRYRNIYEKKSDSELLEIYNKGREWHTDSVLKIIEEILTERNVSFENEDILDLGQLKKNSVTYTAMILGSISLVVTFSLNHYIVYIPEFYSFLVIIIVICRFFFLIYTYDLTTRYSLSIGLWIILVFVFGGWAMIALNIVIIAKFAPDLPPNVKSINKPNIFTFIPTENIKVITEYDPRISADKKEEYINCPACFKNMNGTNKCEDCDLDFG